MRGEAYIHSQPSSTDCPLDSTIQIASARRGDRCRFSYVLSAILKIADQYFRSNTSPDLLVYEEYLVGDKPLDRAARNEVADELGRSHRLLLGNLPPTILYQLFAGIEDCCDPERNVVRAEEFLSSLENAGMAIYSRDALYIFSLPASLAERSIAVTNWWRAPAKYWSNSRSRN